MASGETPGVKRAAVRKLSHELGIEGLSPGQFKFLTRLHYWAADTVTHGPSAEWGENEIDYILFAKVTPLISALPSSPEMTPSTLSYPHRPTWSLSPTPRRWTVSSG